MRFNLILKFLMSCCDLIAQTLLENEKQSSGFVNQFDSFETTFAAKGTVASYLQVQRQKRSSNLHFPGG